MHARTFAGWIALPGLAQRLGLCGLLGVTLSPTDFARAQTSLPATTTVDLRHAVVVAPSARSIAERKAVQLLVEEVAKRTRVRWPELALWPASNTPAIWVGDRASLGKFSGLSADELRAASAFAAAEGFRIWVRPDRDAGRVFVVGNDARGVLFGVGRLLRDHPIHKWQSRRAGNDLVPEMS